MSKCLSLGHLIGLRLLWMRPLHIPYSPPKSINHHTFAVIDLVFIFHCRKHEALKTESPTNSSKSGPNCRIYRQKGPQICHTRHREHRSCGFETISEKAQCKTLCHCAAATDTILLALLQHDVRRSNPKVRDSVSGLHVCKQLQWLLERESLLEHSISTFRYSVRSILLSASWKQHGDEDSE